MSASLGAHFSAVDTTTHEQRLRLSGDEVRTLVGMTPSARHVSPGDLPGEAVEVTAAVELTVHRPR